MGAIRRVESGTRLHTALFTSVKSVASNNVLSGSEIIHLKLLQSHVIVLNTARAAVELLDKRSAIYSGQYVYAI